MSPAQKLDLDTLLLQVEESLERLRFAVSEGLARIHANQQTVLAAVVEVQHALPLQRRPLSAKSKAIHQAVTWGRRNGLCPCCQQVPVCTADGLQDRGPKRLRELSASDEAIPGKPADVTLPWAGIVVSIPFTARCLSSFVRRRAVRLPSRLSAPSAASGSGTVRAREPANSNP
jgi:hypothetical protein